MTQSRKNNKNTFLYAPKIVASPDNIEAKEAFQQIMKDAPKPGDYPDRTIVVKHSYTLVPKKITLEDLLDNNNSSENTENSYSP